MAQGGRERCDAKVRFTPVQANKQVIPQPFAVQAVCARCLQQIRADRDPHPPQLKLPVELVFVRVDVVDQAQRRVIDRHAVVEPSTVLAKGILICTSPTPSMGVT